MRGPTQKPGSDSRGRDGEADPLMPGMLSTMAANATPTASRLALPLSSVPCCMAMRCKLARTSCICSLHTHALVMLTGWLLQCCRSGCDCCGIQQSYNKFGEQCLKTFPTPIGTLVRRPAGWSHTAVHEWLFARALVKPRHCVACTPGDRGPAVARKAHKVHKIGPALLSHLHRGSLHVLQQQAGSQTQLDTILAGQHIACSTPARSCRLQAFCKKLSNRGAAWVYGGHARQHGQA